MVVEGSVLLMRLPFGQTRGLDPAPRLSLDSKGQGKGWDCVVVQDVRQVATGDTKPLCQFRNRHGEGVSVFFPHVDSVMPHPTGARKYFCVYPLQPSGVVLH